MRFMGNIEHAMSVLKSSKAAPPAGTPQRNVVTNVSIPNSSFAQSAVAYTPMRRSGQTAGNTIYTQPSFFSPLHTPQNWQIPSKRREVMQWLALRPMMLTTSDFTMKDVEELSFEAKEAVEDTVTGGIMYEVDCEPILASSGTYRKPCRMSIRDVVDKDAIEFKAVGYWRTMNVTADHKQIWIDGKTHRKKVKLLANASYRASKGIPVGGDKPRHEAWDAKVVKKGLASEISMDDYLLYPVPNTGKQSIDKDAAWLVGNCIADGCITPQGVRFTTGKDESHVQDIIGCLERTFTSKLRSDDLPVISSKQHGLGNGWRVSIGTQSSSKFFSEYITGKLTKKKFTVKAFDLDRESRLNILGGYFDGDGCFADQKLIATNFSMDMSDQIYAMLLSVGIRCALTRHPVAEGSYPTSSEWFYRISIPASDVPMLQPYMKGEKIPSDLVAKPERNLRFFYEEDGVSYLVQPIEYIKQYKYTGQGYDLEIRPEHAYVLNGYVTSNCRYYYENEPKVAAAIDFYSNFAINGFETACEHHAIKKFFDNVNAKLNLDSWTKMMSKEYYLIGDVFPFLEIDCDKCKGSGISREGKLCRHPGGSFRRLVVLNPDWIDVQTNIMVDDPVITMIPDDELKKIVWRKQPKAIYDRLPANIRQLILGNRPIPLSNECVSHLRHNPYPYGTYGVSLLRRLFKTLAYKDKLMSAQWIIAERMILPVRVIKLGDSERPAGPADIADVQAQLANVVNDPNLTLVTHHAFNYDWIGCLSTDYENSFVLCQDGIKHFRDLGEEDLIATWNADNGKVEYQKFIRKVEFDYNKSNSWGYAYRIGNGKWSFLTTPNHRHYLDDGTVKLSEDLVVGDKLLRQDKWSWEGSIPSRLPYLEREEFKDFSLEDFCKFAGYYVAEGHVKREGNKNLSEDKKIQCFGMSQNFSSTCFEDMRALCKKASPTMWETIDERGSGNNYQFMIGNADLSRWMAKEFGDGSYDKKFPSWMMELPASYLRIIWDAMYAGDGTAKRNRYSTASDQLRDQVCNMLVKMGRSPRIDVERGTTPKGKEYKTNRISWGDVCINETFTLTSIEKIPFEGRMWCLEMQNHNFFVKAGKQIILTGNTSGKVLQLSNEYELIDKEILQGLMINDALLSGSMGSYQCHDSQTRALTRNGFKHYDEITNDDEIACFNQDTGKLEYHKAISRHEHDFDGELVHFKTNKIDVAVTDSHRMLFQPRGSDEWTVAKASEVGRRSKFRQTVEWEGSTDYPAFITIGSKTLSLDDYLEIAALYVTEGYVRKESRKSRSTYGEPMSACIYQTPKGKAWDSLLALTARAPVKIAHYESSHGDQFLIHDKIIAAHMENEFGNGSGQKRIPKWIKDLPRKYLSKFLSDMVSGDGTTFFDDRSTSTYPHRRYRYFTISERLKDDVVEIALKCGHTPRSRFLHKGNGIWQVLFSDKDFESETTILHSRRHDVITRMPYKGKVWCFTVPTGFFVTERNGKIAIQGNSAAIGAEAMIQRMESWRLELGRWIEDKIYKPIAQMRGFIDETASKEIGEPVWIYPRVQWNELNIRDDSQQKQLINALFDKGLVSGQTLLEKYNMDYDHEIERLRFESASQKLAGMSGAGGAGGMIGGGAGGGAGGGGMEGLFGGGGAGGMPPGPEAGGAPPGGDPLGGAPPGGAAPAGVAAASVGGTSGKILSKGRKPMQSSVPDEADAQPVTVRLTSLEAMMHKEISAMRLPFSIGVQQTIGPYVADFCVPALRLDIEVDGAYWHNQPETKAHDNIRDKELSQAGWTVLRFGEADLKERMPDVRKTIVAYVQKNWRRAIEDNKRRTNALEESLRLTKFAGEDSVEVEAHIAPAEVEESGNSNQGEGNPVG